LRTLGVRHPHDAYGQPLNACPPPRSAGHTGSAIFAVARGVMVERGPDAMTLSEMAQRAGVNRGTAYQHFRNRDQLARAVRDDFSEHIGRRLSEERQQAAARFGAELERLLDHGAMRPDPANTPADVPALAAQ
jgi:AcrR family transcriptional regulator